MTFNKLTFRCRGAVFELIGATSACALAYILPPLCYMKLSTRSWKTVPACLCVVFGTVVMGISLIQATTKIIRSTVTSLEYIPNLTADSNQTRVVQKPARMKGVKLRHIQCGPADVW